MTSMTELETLLVRLVGDNSSYKGMLAESTKATDDTAEHIRFSTKRIEAFGVGLKGYGANAVAALTPLLGIGVGLSTVFRGVKLASDMEQLEVSFKTLTGSAVVAGETLKDLTKFAADTPYQLPEVVEAAKQMLAFGEVAENIVPTMRMLGDVASGLNIPLGQLTYLFGTLKSQGRAFTVDINQFAMRGIPIWDQLGKQFGKTNAEVRKMVEEGKVGFADVEKAFKAMTGEGGRFHDLMKDQSKTTAGMYSTMLDDIEAVLRTVGGMTIEYLRLKEAIGGVSAVAKEALVWVKAIPGWIIVGTAALTALVAAVGSGAVAWSLFGGVVKTFGSAVAGILPVVTGVARSLLGWAVAGPVAAAANVRLAASTAALTVAETNHARVSAQLGYLALTNATANKILAASLAEVTAAQAANTVASTAAAAASSKLAARNAALMVGLKSGAALAGAAVLYLLYTEAVEDATKAQEQFDKVQGQAGRLGSVERFKAVFDKRAEGKSSDDRVAFIKSESERIAGVTKAAGDRIINTQNELAKARESRNWVQRRYWGLFGDPDQDLTQNVKDAEAAFERAKALQAEIDKMKPADPAKSDEAALTDSKKLMEKWQQEAEWAGKSAREIEVLKAAKANLRGEDLKTLEAEAKLADSRDRQAETWKKELDAHKSRQDTIKGTIKSLEQEAATYGMSAKEKAVYEAKLLGADGAQLNRIGMLAGLTEQAKEYENQVKNATKATERFDAALFGSAEMQSRVEAQRNLFAVRDAPKFDPRLLTEAAGIRGTMTPARLNVDSAPNAPAPGADGLNGGKADERLKDVAGILREIRDKPVVSLEAAGFA